MASNQVSKQVHNVWLMLKISYGLLFIIAGLDKLFNFLVPWGQYVNPIIFHFLGINFFQYMFVILVIEVLLGIIVLTRWTKLGAYGIAVWFFFIIINLLSLKLFFDVAARDFVLAVGAIALGKLTDIKNAINSN